jgi:NitT/TauT family transport system ATP-binding protein
MTAIDIRDVSLQFGEGSGARQILTGINLQVRAGEFLSVIGPSGCGKTTLLRLIAGLLQPTGGSIVCDDREVKKPSRDRAIVFQDYNKALLPWRKIWSNVALPLEDRKSRGGDLRARAIELLQVMRLEAVADQYPDQLSGGMQQRVQIARSLAQGPKIWLMDEPFGALDAITRQQLQDEVARLAAERKMTVVFITHDLEEAIYLGDRVVVLGAHPGRIVEEITVALPRPRDQLTTREDPKFLAHRHHLFGLLQGH